MISWLGRLFGTEKAMNTAVTAVRDGLDALVYTDEERAGDAAKDRSEARSMFIEWVRNSQGQNLARRILAIMIAFVWLGQYVLIQVLLLASVWYDSKEVVEKLTNSADVISDAAQSMNGAMMLILGFYFAAPHLGKIAESAIKKFGR